MPTICVAVLLGAYSVGLLPQLPGTLAASGVASIAILALLSRRNPLPAAFCTGWLISWLACWQTLDQQLSPALAGETLSLRMQIADFVSVHEGNARIIASPTEETRLPDRIRLSWYQPPETPVIGQIWVFSVRLRPPRGFSNPGGFDYEGWLFRNRIGATGYIIEGNNESPSVVNGAPSLATLRGRLAERIRGLLPADDARAVVAAITVGARNGITRDAWSRYAATGTSHLMAISGLHIGLAAGTAFLVAWGIAALFSPRSNLQSVAAMASVPAVIGYAAISGLALPAQRAGLMALLSVLAVVCRRPGSALRQLSVACLLALAVNPVSIWSPGFQLSFLAVAVLLRCAVPVERHGNGTVFDRIRRAPIVLWRLQIALLLGLLALTTLHFQRVPLASPVVNMLVLPIFTFLSVPLSLSGLLFDGVLAPLGDPLLLLAHASVWLSLQVVEFAEGVPGSGALLPVTAISGTIVALCAVLHVVLPAGCPGRRVAWLALLATLMQRPDPVPQGCVDMTVLDVGQGLGLVFRTRRSTIVYDTGPAFRSSDAASLVMLPWLDNFAAGRIDMLVISHADLDHAGGVKTLFDSREISTIVVGEPADLPIPAFERCTAGQSWRFDSLRLEVLHPHADAAWTGNNASCVILASIGEHRILLTGDIEAYVEYLLAESLDAVHTVVIPHHGSKTSSSQRFVDALRPDLAIVSTGYRNRWSLPAAAVVRRWQATGSEVLNTATDGAISQRYCIGRRAGDAVRNRHAERRFWSGLTASGIR